MCGIYIHIPFCKSRCTYCDFYTQTNLTDIDSYIDCLSKELYLQKSFFQKSEKIKTIYFGGGTPSVLKKIHLDVIFNTISRYFNLELSEVTFEVNPDDISNDYLDDLIQTPINRFSLGVQTFVDDQLLAINRRHSASKALESIRNIQDKGYSNISIDLIYGLPKQSLEQWSHNLQIAMTLNIPHISAYHLVYEPNTKLFLDLKKGLVEETKEELSVDMYELLVDTLSTHGYEHYEISNFARNKMYSEHNSSYWLDKKYLGVGVGAHSYDGQNRFYNLPSLNNYKKSLLNGVLYNQIEKLNINEQYNEYIFTGLRTMWGINRLVLKERFGCKYLSYFDKVIQQYIDSENVNCIGTQIAINEKNMLISDKIMSDLMCID